MADLSDLEYDKLEDVLNGTEKGRAFLRMRDRRTRLIASDELANLLRDVKAMVSGSGSNGESRAQLNLFKHELQEIADTIQQTRGEIAALKPVDSGSSRIVAATNELDAIVSATERATSDILEASEKIQTALGDLRAAQEAGDADAQHQALDEIDAQSIAIMTACSFQDITGQRTTKVVHTLRYIEQRVNGMIHLWGEESADKEGGGPVMPDQYKPDDTRPDAHLMHGPQLNAVSQDDIDKLFAAVGGPSGSTN